MIRGFLLILHTATLLAAFSGGAFEENQLNPYSANDRRVADFPLRVAVGGDEDSLKMSAWLTWDDFRHRYLLYDVADDYNKPDHFGSKLSRKLMSWVTNTGDPEVDIPESLRDSVKITSDMKPNRVVSPFSLETHRIALSMKRPLSQMELVDVISSSSQVSVEFWQKYSFVGKGNHEEINYKTDDEDVIFFVKYQIIASKLGQNHFNIYFLVRLNDQYNSVMTYSGSYFVLGTELPFDAKFGKPQLVVRYGKVMTNPLHFMNRMRHTLGVGEVKVAGAYVSLAIPSTNGKGKIQERRNCGGKIVQLGFTPQLDFPPKAQRPPLAELVFYHPGFNVTMELNETKTTGVGSATVKSKLGWPEYWECEDPTHPSSEIRERTGMSRLGIQDSPFAHVESHTVTFLLDSKRYYYNFLTFFSHKRNFFDHEDINLGVMCDREVSHSASVFVSNKYGRPVILRSFRVVNLDSDFRIKLATPYSPDLLLPFVGEPFLLLKVIVSYQGLVGLAHLKASLVATLEVGSDTVEEELALHCTFNDRLFSIIADNNELGVGPGTETFFLHVIQDTGQNVTVSRLDIHANPDNDNMYALDSMWSRMMETHKGVMPPSQTIAIYHFTFLLPKNDSKKLVNRFTFTFHTLETFFSTQVAFPYKKMLCTRGRYAGRYQFCGDEMVLDLGELSPRAGKSVVRKTLKIRNNEKGDFYIFGFKLAGIDGDASLKVTFKLKDRRTEHFIGRYTFVASEEPKSEQLEMLVHGDEEFLAIFEVSLPSGAGFLGKDWQSEVAVEFQLKDKPAINVILRYALRQQTLFIAEPLVANFTLTSVLEKAEQTFRIVSRLPGTIGTHTLNVFGSDKEMVKVEVLENDANDGLWVFSFRATMDPTILLGSRGHRLRVDNDPHRLTVKDLDLLEKEQQIWELLKAKGSYKFRVRLVVKTDAGTKTTFKWKGKLRRVHLVDREVVVRYDGGVPVSHAPITLNNPSKRMASFRLFIAPTRFFDFDQIMEEVKGKLKGIERKEFLGTTCLEHAAIGSDLARFLVSRMIRTRLKFVDVSRASPVTSSHAVCFRTLRPTVQRKYQSQLKNLQYFFRFSHVDLAEVVSNYLNGKLLILKDIEEYSADNRLISGHLPMSRFSRLGMTEFLWTAGRALLRLFWGSAQPREPRQRFDDAKTVYVPSLKNGSAYLLAKSTFLGDSVVGRTFRVPGLSNMTLQDALVFATEVYGNSSRDELSLFVKTDTGLVDKVPIVFEKRVCKLGHLHPDPGLPSNPNNTIFVNLKTSNFLSGTSPLTLPIKRRITFSNDGEIPIRITKINFENGLRNDICLQLSKTRPVTLQPSETVSLILVLHTCRKISSLVKNRLVVHTTAQRLTFDLQVHFEDFHVTLSRKNHLVFLVFFGQGCVFTFLAVWFSFWLLRRQKKPETTEVRYVGGQCAFLAKDVRFEKLCKFIVTIRFGVKKRNSYRRQLVLDEFNRRETEEPLLPELESEEEEDEAVDESQLRIPLHELMLPSDNGQEARMTEYSNTSLALVNEIINDAMVRDDETNPSDKKELLQKAQVAVNINLTDNQFGVIGDRVYPLIISRMSPPANKTTSMVSPIATRSRFSFQISEYKELEPSLELEDMQMEANWSPGHSRSHSRDREARSMEHTDLEQIFDLGVKPEAIVNPMESPRRPKPKFYSKEELDLMEKNIFEPQGLTEAKLRLHQIISGVNDDKTVLNYSPRKNNRRKKRKSEG